MKIQSIALCALLLSLPAASNARNVTFVPPADNEVPEASSTSGAATRGTFIPPADNEVPEAASTSGAATRSIFMSPGKGDISETLAADSAAPRSGACQSASATGLQALLPEQHNYGATVQARPTILMHLPATQATQGFFSLKVETPDASERTLYNTTVTLTPNRAGIISWQLPEDAPALEVGKTYHWYFVLQCGDSIRVGDPYIDGWVRRIQPPETLSEPLPKEEIEVAAIYGRAGIWYDLLATMAARYQAQPGNQQVLAQWQDLLTSETVGLGQLDNAPLFAQP